MKLGMFLMPSHPPERSLYDATEWDLEMIQYADQLGYEEAWIGEHFTSPWEPIPAPDLLIAQALKSTKQIKLAPGAHLLPYHNPVELAHRVAYLDNLSQGRLMLGIGAGGLPSDYDTFGVDGLHGENRRMTAEALEIMLKIWKEKEPFEYKGEYWKANRIEGNEFLRPHIEPYQKPHPQIGVTGLSPGSETLIMAGEKGFIPMSLGNNLDYIASHWKSVEEGAKRSGKTPQRSEWRITRDVFVADTDEEALEGSLYSMMGRQHREYYLPLFKTLRAISVFKHKESVDDNEVTPEYVAKHNWFVGSPETVATKFANIYEKVGGFGTLLVTGYDYSENPEAWKKSMRLLKEEVLPRLASKLSKVEI
ncbi:LLM class flavin-dependent oxidoreductase [Peribacillus cavernae]|uniref:LLM class flavin-dependent oxidoreductase n=2 Tax=Peribacillus cavernae TaxID=1674310 RepID=A0A433HJR4_9BACI|nr:LLM class flavin-dependent oxidoreductase [Peribacillus cavernae]RUQ28630.1 LLM class flavin-dependent oxidoreductase [Peribacillus cavernae]